MHEWLEWARGPVFRFAFLFMVLGMFRLMALNLLSLRSVARRAGNKEIPVARVLRSTVQWLLPHGGAVSRDPVFTMASVLFHIAMIITPVFLGAHILLWQRGLGVSWPALSQPLADTLTLVGVDSRADIDYAANFRSREPRAEPPPGLPPAGPHYNHLRFWISGNAPGRQSIFI